jgi:hypothetical protein
VGALSNTLIAELFRRYAIGLGEHAGAALALGVLVIAVSIPLWVGPPTGVPRAARWSLLAAVVGLGVAWGYQLLWFADDAFISFRYAQNLLHGHGLVWNVGERVEGYTNFLWTLLTAGGMALGVDPLLATTVLSLGSFAGVLIVTDRLVDALRPPRSPLVVSFAALALASNYVFASFATSGMETMFGAFLALLALYLAHTGRPLAAGCAGIAATLTHPDHAVFYASLGAALVWDRERRGGLWRYALPLVAVYLPYQGWRSWYYGDCFPNTFYAKSGDLSYFEQGGRYLVITLIGAGLPVVAPLAIAAAVRRWRSLPARTLLISLPVYLLYVAKIGGDFMLGRLAVPVLPLLFVFAECSVRDWYASRRRWVSGLGPVALLGVLLAAIPVRIIQPGEKAWYVADERTFYLADSARPEGLYSPYYHWAKEMRAYFVQRGVHPRLAVGSTGMLGYFTGLDILDIYGLTDRTVAHQAIHKRDRPGHEKTASPSYVYARRPDLSQLAVFPQPYWGVTGVEVGTYPLPYHFVRYDPAFVDQLRGVPQLRFREFSLYFDHTLALPPEALRSSLFCDAWFYDKYYFAGRVDPVRLQELRSAFVRAQPSLRTLEPFLMGPLPTSGWEAIEILDFDHPEDRFRSEGDAFSVVSEPWPDEEAFSDHDAMVGCSYTPPRFDEARGTLTTEPFRIVGTAITFLLGGGSQPGLRVELVVDGVSKAVARGCDSEMLGRRVWNVRDLQGKTGVIRVVDEAGGSWGHLVIDEIAQWRPRR